MGPRAYILSRPQFEESYQQFLDYSLPGTEATWKHVGPSTQAERLVEFSGRVCYMSFGSKQSNKTTTEYIHNLIRHGHESVLEHVCWTFALAGVTRSFTHQFVRHRVGFAFSQLSQQYHDESEARFVRPFGIEKVPEAVSVWDEAVRDSHAAYRKLFKLLEITSQLHASVPKKEINRALRSAARSVLPNATETAIVFTANARALRHFLRVRGGIIGDLEMRFVAAALLELVRPEAPAIFSDYNIGRMEAGAPIVIYRPLDDDL